MKHKMKRVFDNFGLIVRAFFTLAGVTYMILSMSAFHIYSTNKISLWKTSKHLVDDNESMKIKVAVCSRYLMR